MVDLLGQISNQSCISVNVIILWIVSWVNLTSLCSTFSRLMQLYKKVDYIMKIVSEPINAKNVQHIQKWWEFRSFVIEYEIPMYYEYANPIIAWILACFVVVTVHLIYRVWFVCDGDILVFESCD